MLTPTEFHVKFAGLVEDVLGGPATEELFALMSALSDDVPVDEFVRAAIPAVA